MKYYLSILLLFIYSCDGPWEESGPLDYEDLIIEGWNNFIDKDYQKAEEFFLDILDINSSLLFYYSEAYLGLGWTAIYKAKELSEINIEERMAIREAAKEWFMDAIDEMDSYTGEEQEALFNLKSDLYAGLSYIYSSMVLYNEYSNGDDLDELINSAINFSDSLLFYDSEYSFLYDSENINSNSIHLLRAQLFLETGNYDQAQNEISQINAISSQVHFNLEINDDSIYDLFLHAGFQGQDKHFFEMSSITDSTFEVTRSFTPSLPCLDLILEGVDLSNNEIVECLNSFSSNVLEYKYAMRVPSYDGYIYIMEELNDLECTSNGFRTLSIEDSDSLIPINSCYGSCLDCDN